MLKNKTAQLAIVCLYIRKRNARRWRDNFAAGLKNAQATHSQEICLERLRAAENRGS